MRVVGTDIGLVDDLETWIRYGRIVDARVPCADERETVDTFHSVRAGLPVPASTDPRLVEAAKSVAAGILC